MLNDQSSTSILPHPATAIVINLENDSSPATSICRPHRQKDFLRPSEEFAANVLIALGARHGPVAARLIGDLSGEWGGRSCAPFHVGKITGKAPRIRRAKTLRLMAEEPMGVIPSTFSIRLQSKQGRCANKKPEGPRVELDAPGCVKSSPATPSASASTGYPSCQRPRVPWSA